MRDVNAVLDSIKSAQKIGSDYKLAMYLGLGSGNLRNYRHGRSLPDVKACQKLAAAMGEKPDLLMVEMQAQREKDSDARALWASLAKRLQMGFSNVLFLAVVAMISLASTALPALASEKTAVSAYAVPAYYVKYFVDFQANDAF